MTPNELATFLREEMLRIKKHAAEFPYKDALRSDEADLLSALTACVGLLREAATKFDEIAEGKGAFSRDHMEHCENTVRDMIVLAREAATTLRLVVGPEERT